MIEFRLVFSAANLSLIFLVTRAMCRTRRCQVKSTYGDSLMVSISDGERLLLKSVGPMLKFYAKGVQCLSKCDVKGSWRTFNK